MRTDPLTALLQRWREEATRGDATDIAHHGFTAHPSRTACVEALAAVLGPLQQEEKEQDDQARVVSVPEGEHGDLPRRATE